MNESSRGRSARKSAVCDRPQRARARPTHADVELGQIAPSGARSIFRRALPVSVAAATLGLASAAAAQDFEEQYEQQTETEVDTGSGVSTGTTTETTTYREEERREHDESRRFGDMGHVVISAERMFGVGFTWDSVDVGADDNATVSTFNLSVLSNPLGTTTNTYSFPRMGFDFFIAENLSIGASLGFAYTSFDEDEELQGVALGDSITTFLAAPRVGYAFMFADGIGIWPRIGVTWLWATTSGDAADLTANRFALTFEAPFVISPTDNVAFLLGPKFDLGLSGSNKIEAGGAETETDVKATELGIYVGLLTYF